MYDILIKKVMDLILDGDSKVLNNLKYQYNNSVITNIEMTGKGFYVNFKVNSEIEPIKDGVKHDYAFGDVNGVVDGIVGAVGFILFVKNGYITTLEGYSNVPGSWENVDDDTQLVYLNGKRNLKEIEDNWNLN